MSSGFFLKNDSNLLLVSSETYNLSFIGKASFYAREGAFSNSSSPSHWITSSGGTNYNLPIGNLWRYTINTAGRDAIFFVYAQWPSLASVLTAEKTGDTYDITVAAMPGGAAGAEWYPVVYAFSRMSAAGGGYGMNVYDSSGGLAFSTESNPLIVKALYNANYPASNTVSDAMLGTTAQRAARSSDNSAEVLAYTAPMNPNPSIAKPIIFFPAHESATYFVSSIFSFHEIGARYNNTTKNLETGWFQPHEVGATSGANIQRPARTGFTLVADGVDYD